MKYSKKTYFKKNGLLLLLTFFISTSSVLFGIKRKNDEGSNKEHTYTNEEIDIITNGIQTYLRNENEKDKKKRRIEKVSQTQTSKNQSQQTVIQPQALIVPNQVITQMPLPDKDEKLLIGINAPIDDEMLNIIFENAFQYLNIKSIKRVRLTNKALSLLMTHLLKQSMRTVIISSGDLKDKDEYNRFHTPLSSHFITQKYDRSFALSFTDIDTLKENKQLACDAVKSMTLNTEFIFFEIHTFDFLDEFLKAIFEVITQKNSCKKLKKFHCFISRINTQKIPAPYFINKMFEIANNVDKNNIPTFHFSFFPDGYKSQYKKTLNKQLNGTIKFPTQPYNMIVDNDNDMSFKKIPNIEQFLNKPNTLKKIDINLYHENISDFIQLYSANQQNQAQEAKIDFAPLSVFDLDGCSKLINVFLDTNLYPALKTLRLTEIKVWLNSSSDPEAQNIISYLRKTENNVLEELSIDSRFESGALIPYCLVEYFLQYCKNLKTISFTGCNIGNLSNSNLFKDSMSNQTFSTKSIAMSSNVDKYTNVTAQANIFFTLKSLQLFIAHFPELNTISLNNIFLQHNKNNNEIIALCSYIQKLSTHVKNIHFEIAFTNELKSQTNKSELKKIIKNLEEYLQSNKFDFSIKKSLNKFMSLSISIKKP